jgi:hypothetical protein
MKPIIYLLCFLALPLAAQTNSNTMIIGRWKNCGTYSLDASGISLYKSTSDTCDNYGKDCPQTIWEFSNANDSQTLVVTHTSSCKNILTLSVQANAKQCTWLINEKGYLLTISFGEKKYQFTIKMLDKNHLLLSK